MLLTGTDKYRYSFRDNKGEVQKFLLCINNEWDVEPVCQTNGEIHLGEISEKFGSNFDMPVVYFSQPVSVSYGLIAEE